ncbi:trans-sulfuration enzyme family protein [Haloarchaeobius sp. TZWSO28]|uniref:trans-sulfuration enzyme family protein n=1 Tax=Haloarchaeobius sp. TZWSO28 TaxID=3446119 RepID=UPI003EBA2752
MNDGEHPGRFETLAVSHGEEPTPGEPQVGDVVSPIHLASTFALPGLDTSMSLEDIDPDNGEFVYSRLSNPTRHALEKRLGALEGGKHAFAFSSGTAAIASVVMSVVRPGDHIVAFDDLYAGTRRMFEDLFTSRLNVDVSFVDATETANVADAITDDTTMVWMETPTNPRMKMCDIGAIAELADDADAVFGVDNTFMSPYFQSPLDLGADVVAHSTTKYLNGHSDSVGGAVIMNDDELADQLTFIQQIGLGDMLSPFDSYLLMRGIKTLPLRMRQHEANATVIAEYLEDHDLVESVFYPGLESHPQHDLANEQMHGYGGVLSFELAGDITDAKAFLESLEEFTLAVSLGGVESLIELPAGMTHEPLPKAEREALGITDTLVRVSVGIEHIDDLIADLDRGFDVLADRVAVTA